MKNGVTTWFFFLIPKIWVGRTMVNGEKKEDGLMLIGGHKSMISSKMTLIRVGRSGDDFFSILFFNFRHQWEEIHNSVVKDVHLL